MYHHEADWKSQLEQRGLYVEFGGESFFVGSIHLAAGGTNHVNLNTPSWASKFELFDLALRVPQSSCSE